MFAAEGATEVGAVRQVEHDKLVIYIENAGDFTIAASAVAAVHDGKVVLDGNHDWLTARTAAPSADLPEDGLFPAAEVQPARSPAPAR